MEVLKADSLIFPMLIQHRCGEKEGDGDQVIIQKIVNRLIRAGKEVGLEISRPIFRLGPLVITGSNNLSREG